MLEMEESFFDVDTAWKNWSEAPGEWQIQVNCGEFGTIGDWAKPRKFSKTNPAIIVFSNRRGGKGSCFARVLRNCSAATTGAV